MWVYQPISYMIVEWVEERCGEHSRSGILPQDKNNPVLHSHRTFRFTTSIYYLVCRAPRKRAPGNWWRPSEQILRFLRPDVSIRINLALFPTSLMPSERKRKILENFVRT